jgi:hypothetical protein
MDKIRPPGNKPVLTFEQYKIALELQRQRREMKTFTQLAKEFGVNKGSLTSAVIKGVKQYDWRIMREDAKAKAALRNM